LLASKMLDVAKESRMQRGVDGQEECSSSRAHRRQLAVVLERRRRGQGHRQGSVAGSGQVRSRRR
jgi:hypothetical protein